MRNDRRAASSPFNFLPSRGLRDTSRRPLLRCSLLVGSNASKAFSARRESLTPLGLDMQGLSEHVFKRTRAAGAQVGETLADAADRLRPRHQLERLHPTLILLKSHHHRLGFAI